jgi:translation machinery-associated protein 16
VIVDRLTWFQGILDEDQTCLTEDDMHDLILLYISRFDEEIDSLKTSQRPGRPIPKRLDELEMAKKQECDEYQKGFTIPDLRDARNVQVLKNWKGDYTSVSLFKQIKLVAPKDE